MPPKPSTGSTAGMTIRIPDNVAEFYANSLQIAVTAWDVMLMFGSTVIPETFSAGGAIKVEGRVDAVVRMSPQHAKAMLRSISAVLADYEKQFGEIHIPEEGGDNANPAST